MALFQYQPLAAPIVPTTPTLTPLSWAPEFADRVSAPSRTPDTQAAYTLWQSVAPLLQAWQGEWPDRAAQSPRAPESQAVNPFWQSTSPLLNAWLAEYPDRFAGQRTPESAAAYPLWQSISPLLNAWLAEYADSVASRRNPIEAMQALAFIDSPAFPVERFAWRGVWPDKINAARFQLEAQKWFALNEFPISVPTDQLGWRGGYPDWLTRLEPAEYPAFTTGLTASSIPVPRPLVWQGRWADFASAAKRSADFPAFAFSPFPIAVPTDQLGWRGSYTDWIARLRPAEYPAFVTGLTASSIPLPRPLAWQGAYPDTARGPQALLAQLAFSLNAFPLPSLTPLSWAPEFADLIARALRTPEGGAVSLPNPQVTVPLLESWLSEFVDRIARQAAPEPGLFAGANPQTTTPFAWYAQQLDLRRGPTRVVDTAQAYPFQIVPVNQLGWRGAYPDFARGDKFLTALQQALATGSTASTIPLPRPMVWQGHWEDFARGKRLPEALMPFWSPWGNLQPPPVIFGWQGVFPEMAPGRMPINVGPSLVFVRLVVFGPPDVCVHDQRYVMAMFIGEYAAQPSVSDEEADQPKIDGERKEC